MSEAWKQYVTDFDAMSDAEISQECEAERRKLDEAESWLEAVESWEAAGKPRIRALNSTTIAKQEPSQ